MAEYGELNEFLDPHLTLTVNGKPYTIPAPNIEEGIHLVQLFDTTKVQDFDEIEEIKKVLGPVWEEMVADGVSYPEFYHVGRTALMHYGAGPAIAETYWREGSKITGNSRPAPPKGNRERDSKKDRTDSMTPTPAHMAKKIPAEARGSQRPASGNGTTRKPRPKKKK